MIAGRGPLTVLIAAAVGVLLALIALPSRPPGAAPERSTHVDRHTGAAVPTADALRRRLRATGEAGTALGALRALDPTTRASAALHDLEELLLAELSVPTPSERPVAPPTQPDELVDWLTLRDGDGPIAAATERLFLNEEGLDGDAARYAARLRDGSRPVSPATCLGLARRFEQAGRPRARDRWLRHAFAADPTAPDTRRGLAEALVGAGRHQAARAVLGPAHRRDDLPLVALRADVAGWLGDAATEAADLDRLRDGADSSPIASVRADPVRAAELHEHLGAPDAALPHAEDLARAAGTAAALRQVGLRALRAGAHERGFALLHEALDAEDDPALRRELADLALADQRIELARSLRASGPTMAELADDDPLATRARRADAETAARYSAPSPAAIAADPPAHLAEADTQIALLVALGQRDAARALARAVADWPLPTPLFFARLDRFASAGVADLDGRVAHRLSAVDLDTDALPALLAEVETAPENWPTTLDALRRQHLGDPRVLASVVRAWVDHPEDAAVRLLRAERLTELYPHDARVRAVQVDRAAWAGDRPAELDARVALLRLAPDDLDNRSRIVDLHAALGTPLRAASAAAGLDVLADDPFAASLRTARLLFDADLPHSARSLLADRLRATDLSADRLRATAATCFDLGFQRLAHLAYQRLDALEPGRASTRLRLGLLAAWSGDPRNAIPDLRAALGAESLTIDDLDRGTRDLAHHQLGEALWSTGAVDEATIHYETVLRGTALLPTPLDREPSTRAAHALRRLGRPADAAELLLDCRRRWPDDRGVALALVECLDEAGRRDDADLLLATLLAADPLPGDAALLAIRRSAASEDPAAHATARTLAAQLLAAHPATGPVDAAQVHAVLGELDLRTGHYRDAVTRFQRWQALAPEDPAAAAALDRARRPLDTHLLFTGRWRAVADDRTTSVSASASTALDDGLRLHTRLGHARYQGRSPAVASGSRELDSDTVLFDATLEHATADGSRHLTGGVSLFPGLDGQAPLGGFVAARFSAIGAAYRSLELRAGVQELWDDPAAAPSLEGRRDSLAADGYASLDDATFAGAALRLRRLSARDPNTGERLDDLQLDGQLTLGRVLTGPSSAAVSDRFRIDQSRGLPNWLDLTGAAQRDPRVSAWLSWQSIHLLGDAELPALLPIGDRFDYALLGARAEQVFADGFGAGVEGFAGYEIHSGDPSFALEGSATWQPDADLQFTLRGGWGRALGRADENPDSYEVFAEGRIRW